jgi:hypothetical protein
MPLIACAGNLLAAGRHICQKLLVVSELVRQQTILYHSDIRSIPDRIVSFSSFMSGRSCLERHGVMLRLEP